MRARMVIALAALVLLYILQIAATLAPFIGPRSSSIWVVWKALSALGMYVGLEIFVVEPVQERLKAWVVGSEKA